MGSLTPCFVPGGFVHNDCPAGGGFLPPSSRVRGFVPGGEMVLDEIDSCIRKLSRKPLDFRDDSLSCEKW